MRREEGILPPAKGARAPASRRVRAPSACWRGDGPPRLTVSWSERMTSRTGTEPAALGLRYCPDSYGRLQSRIIRNGGNPDDATLRGG